MLYNVYYADIFMLTFLPFNLRFKLIDIILLLLKYSITEKRHDLF